MDAKIERPQVGGYVPKLTPHARNVKYIALAPVGDKIDEDALLQATNFCCMLALSRHARTNLA